MQRLFVLLLLIAGIGYAQIPDQELNLALAAEILSENNAKIFPGSELRTMPLMSGDSEITVGWIEQVSEYWPMLRSALELYTWPTAMQKGTPSRFIDDPVIDGVKYNGRWRQAVISRVRQQTAPDQFRYWIVLTLRSGYASELLWDEARLVERKQSESNTESVPSIAETLGLDPAESATIRFQNLNPYKINKISAQLNEEAYTNLVVYGETLEGQWYNVMVTAGKQDDGSGIIDMILSRQVFTVRMYDAFGTQRQSSIYRIFNVPKTIAQKIIDQWQGQGRGASIDYNTERELCHITLVDRDTVQDNLTTSWMKDGCEYEYRMIFAWGYTKEQLDSWITINSGTGDTQATTRKLSVSERGDGLFNATIEERKFTVTSGNMPQFSITLPIGTKITRQIDHGWNYNSSQMKASSFRNQYNTQYAAVGRTIDMRVTREDDCSFDWTAEIREQTAPITGYVNTGTNGIGRQTYNWSGLKSSEVVGIQSSIQSDKRKRVDIDLNVRDDELAEIKANIVTVQTAETNTTVGDVEILVGGNTDGLFEGDMLNKVLRGVSINPQDDGTYGYQLTISPLYTNLFEISDSSNLLGRAHYQTGYNQDDVIDVKGQKLRSANVSKGENDKWNFQIISDDLDPVIKTIESEGTGIRKDMEAGININSTNIPTPTSTRLKRDVVDVRPQPEGLFTYTRSIDYIESSTNQVELGTLGYSSYETIKHNVEGITESRGDEGVTVELLSAGFDDAGNMQYRVRTITRHGITNEVQGGTLLNPTTFVTGTGDLVGPTDSIPEQGISYAIDASINPDGTREWKLRKQTAATNSITLLFHRTNPTMAQGGSDETVTIFRNMYSVEPIEASQYGYYRNFRINDDGTYDGERVNISYHNAAFYSNAVPSSNLTYVIKNLDWAWSGHGRTDEDEYRTVVKKYKTKRVLEVQYTAEESYHNTYSSAISAINGGLDSSSVELINYGGTLKWKAKKITLGVDQTADWVDEDTAGPQTWKVVGNQIQDDYQWIPKPRQTSP